MKCSSCILGTAQFSGSYGITNPKKKYDAAELASILSLALRHGICRIDTALSYPGVYGILADALLQISGKSTFKIATKFAFKGLSPDQYFLRLEQSRRFFPQNEIDIVFIHDWDQLDCGDLQIVREVASASPNTRIGASIYEPRDLEVILSEVYPVSVIQIPLSILNQTFVPYISTMQEKGIEIWARSIFLQGAIDWRSKRNIFLKHPSIMKLQEVGRDLNVSPFELALDFIKRFPIEYVFGVASTSQLIEIFKLLQLPRSNLDYDSFASKDIQLIDPRTW